MKAEAPRRDSEAWKARAACRGMDPSIFYGNTDTAFARLVCARCDVPDECRAEHTRLTQAIGEDPGGVWFGTTEQERRKAKR